jgi:hypothetical protein
MARSTGRGDDRAVRRDGPAGAGSGPSEKTRTRGMGMTGQQSGSTRPAVKTGAAKKAPKKGEIPPKGGARKTRVGKDNTVRASRSKKPSKAR